MLIKAVPMLIKAVFSCSWWCCYLWRKHVFTM